MPVDPYARWKTLTAAMGRVRPDPAPSVPRPDPAPKPPRRPGPQQTLTPIGTTFGPPPPPPPPVPRVAPPPAAVAAPPPAVAAPPPATPDFTSYYQSDPRYLTQNPILEALRGQIYAKFGWMPDPAHPGKFIQASATDNPYSVVQNLAKQMRSQSADVTNYNNAHGILVSGGQISGQQGAVDDYNRNLNEQSQNFQGELGNISQQQASLISSLYPDYAKMAGTLGAPVAEPAAAASGSAAAYEALAPQAKTDLHQANNSALSALAKTSGLTQLAQLYNAWKGKVDDNVLRQIDAKLKQARAKGGK